VPPIIFGTSALGNLYKALDEKNKLEIISNWFRFVKSPVIDTAGKYGAGLALEVIGNGLRKLRIASGNITISNKLGWYRTKLETPEPTFEPGVWVDLKHDAIQTISYDGIMACYEQGIELLGGKYKTEILSVHDPDEYLADSDNRTGRMVDILEGYQALSDLKSQGKARAIGIGAKDWKVIKMITDQIDLDWVMLATSFTIKEHPLELMEFMAQLKERKISIINSAVFHGGFLTGSDYYNYRKLDPASSEDGHLYQWREEFYDVCLKYKIKPSDACIVFGLAHPGIAAIALNTSRPDAIQKNIELLDKKIPDSFWVELKDRSLVTTDYDII